MLGSVHDPNQGPFLGGGSKIQHHLARSQRYGDFVGDDGAHQPGLDPNLNLVGPNRQAELPGLEEDVASDLFGR